MVEAIFPINEIGRDLALEAACVQNFVKIDRGVLSLINFILKIFGWIWITRIKSQKQINNRSPSSSAVRPILLHED